jgi:hypothetical protein
MSYALSWAVGPGTMTSLGARLSDDRVAGLSPWSPGQATWHPCSGPIAHVRGARPCDAGGTPRAPTATPWLRVVLPDTFGRQATQSDRSQGRKRPRANTSGTRTYRLTSIMLYCAGYQIIDIQDQRGRWLSPRRPSPRRDEWPVGSGLQIHQQGAPMPLKQPVRFAAARGRAARDVRKRREVSAAASI